MQHVEPSTARTRMRRRGTVIAAALATGAASLVLVSALTANAATLFTDDFQDGNANGWVATSGSWSVVSDAGNYVYRQSSTTADARSLGGSMAGAFTFVSARVKPTSSYGAVGLLSRAKDANTYYYVALHAGLLEVGKRLNGTTTVLATAPYTAAVGAWHSLTLNTFMTDRVSGSVTGPNGSRSVTALGYVGAEFGYQVGFISRATAAQFDDIKLQDDRVVPTLSPSISTAYPPDYFPTRTPSRAPSASPSRSGEYWPSPSPSPSVHPTFSDWPYPPSPSPSRSPSASPPNPVGLSCAGAVLVQSDWGSGFSGLVTVRNSGTLAISGWTVTFTLPPGVSLPNVFNGQFSIVGNTVTVTNMPWNGSIPVGTALNGGAGFVAAGSLAGGTFQPITCTAT
jgi:hypothetical protein